MTPPTRVIILGSTGSIGTQALDVIAHLNALPDPSPRFQVVGLAAGRNTALLLDQAARFRVPHLALRDAPTASPPNLRSGPDAAEDLVRSVPCDLVLAAMVGAAGLPATLAAVELGRTVALANKETLVAAGALVVPAARASGARLLPVDSEHSGVWQALGLPEAPPFTCDRRVRRVTLTASGGPFRSRALADIAAAAPRDALRHPTWTMGPKITIDCASMMNKCLELIEAHWLFGLGPDRLHAVIHPQSIIHALVEFTDGAVVAHLSSPDMRLPIQLALTFPDRLPAPTPPLDLESLARLEFEPVDPARFPAMTFAPRVMSAGGTSGATLNAANEEAVARFLAADGAIPFGRIAELVGEALTLPVRPVRTMSDILAADAAARDFVASRLSPKAVP